MGKYTPLKSFLSERHTTEVPMSFNEIERLIGGQLPPVAFKHRAWWSNNPTNNVMTQAWLEAGYETERVDMAARKLVFVRTGAARAPAPSSHEGSSKTLLDRLRDRLAGTVTIPAGVDITQPLGERWDAEH